MCPMEHMGFLRRQMCLLESEETLKNSTVVCRNGVLYLNSLLTFILLKDDLSNIAHFDEELIVVLPDYDVEVIRSNLDRLLAVQSDSCEEDVGVATFSLLYPFELPVQPWENQERSRRRAARSGIVCKVCGKYFKRTKWEAGAHELLHTNRQGGLSCLVPTGSLGRCLKNFTSKENLQGHMEFAHKIKYLTCSLCNMEFENENEKEQHQNGTHSDHNGSSKTS